MVNLELKEYDRLKEVERQYNEILSEKRKPMAVVYRVGRPARDPISGREGFFSENQALQEALSANENLRHSCEAKSSVIKELKAKLESPESSLSSLTYVFIGAIVGILATMLF